MRKSECASSGFTSKNALRMLIAAFLCAVLACPMTLAQTAYATEADALPASESAELEGELKADVNADANASTGAADESAGNASGEEIVADDPAKDDGIKKESPVEDPAGTEDDGPSASPVEETLVVLEDGAIRFQLSDGSFLMKDWKTWEGKTYYFDEEGYAVTGKQTIDGKLYYFKADRTQYTGWITWNADGRKTYFNPNKNGAAAKGWWILGGKRYYFDNSYKVARYLTKIDGKHYYFNAKGHLYKGWMTWSNGTKSYFNPNKNGAAAKGWWTLGGKRYYFKADTAKSVRYKQMIDGKCYYFNAKSQLYKGWKTWDGGRKSYFNPKKGGAAVKGWWTLSGKRYYFDSSYKNVRYQQTIKGKKYYFNAKGHMQTGWFPWANGAWSYLGTDGVMRTGTKVVNGMTYYFGSDGKTAPNMSIKKKMNAKAQKYASGTSWLILTNTNKNYVAVFSGSKGKWTMRHFWRCSSGAPGATATPSGQFSVFGKQYSFGDPEKTYTCYYATRFYRSVLFHSVPHYYQSSSIMDGRLGYRISHGCIRMSVSSAQWIYNNIPYGTKVVCYR